MKSSVTATSLYDLQVEEIIESIQKMLDDTRKCELLSADKVADGLLDLQQQAIGLRTT